MGKFDGVLLVSDFDDTMLNTTQTIRGGGTLPDIPPYNIERIHYFMDNGGKFAIVSGRAWTSFKSFAHLVPTNAPCGTGNGAAIIDPKTGEALYLHTLPDSISQVMADLEAHFPHFTCEIYRADNETDAIRPNEMTWNHSRVNHYPFQEITNFSQTKLPILKILFEGLPETVEEIRQYIMAQPWYEEYETFFSASTLLELIARGANKGTMVRQLADLCGISLEHTYCIGDQANDIPMLAVAKEAFAPANAIPAVYEFGATILCDCMEGAVGQAIDRLDTIY